MRASAVPLLSMLLLAGCAGPLDPIPPAEPDPQPGPAALPMHSWHPSCVSWSGRIDMPASAYPANATGPPMPGQAPGTVAMDALGYVCGEQGPYNGNRTAAEFWMTWPTADGPAWVGQVWTKNETRGATLAAWGVPVTVTKMSLFYGTRAGLYFNDGVGTTDRQAVFTVEAAFDPLAAEPTTYRLETSNHTLEVVLAGSEVAWNGVARFGDSGLSLTRGPGQRRIETSITFEVTA